MFHLKPSSFDQDVMKLSVENNLTYHKHIDEMISNDIESTEKLVALKDKIIDSLIKKSADSPDYYVSVEDQKSLTYKTFRYRYSETSNEKMYFNVYSITKNEFDSRDTALKLYHNSSPLYFQNVTEFYDYIMNKTISFEQIVYFDVYVNLIKNEFYYTPHIHSINFNKEPIMDNSIRSFNSFAKKEQQEIVKDMISNALENDDFKDMKQPSFYCKPVYFKMDNIQMKDFLEYIQKMEYVINQRYGVEEHPI